MREGFCDVDNEVDKVDKTTGERPFEEVRGGTDSHREAAKGFNGQKDCADGIIGGRLSKLGCDDDEARETYGSDFENDEPAGVGHQIEMKGMAEINSSVQVHSEIDGEDKKEPKVEIDGVTELPGTSELVALPT